MKYRLKKGKIMRINANFKETMKTLIAIKDLEKKGIIENINGIWYLTEKGKKLEEKEII